MGRLYDSSSKYTIRVPVKMTQVTYKNGKVKPVSFEWVDESGDVISILIDSVTLKGQRTDSVSGASGDCYACDINGYIEYAIYSLTKPRKWFILKSVSKEEYDDYYKLI